MLTYNVSCTVCRGNILRGFFDTYILFEYTAMVTRLASEFPPGILLSFALLLLLLLLSSLLVYLLLTYSYYIE